MQKLKIIPSSFLKGTIKNPPPSKSQTMRALIFALLAKGESTIHNYLKSPDTLAMIEAIKILGAKVKIFKKKLKIIGTNGDIRPLKNIINSKNSGIILRFILAISALSNKEITITGDESIKKNRVILPLLDALKQLNVKILSKNKNTRPPITIKGPIKKTSKTILKISGEDSQPISALLIALSFAKSFNFFELKVKNPKETPWIDLTLSWLKFLKIPYKKKGYKYFKIFPNQKIKKFEKFIEKDFSSIAYPIAAALITNSEISINIDINQNMPDKEFLNILKKMNANIEIFKDKIKIKKSKLKGLKIDLDKCIDALPILAVIGCYAEGKTILYNASIARKKESDRISSICKELKKMKAKIKETKDGLIIEKSTLFGSSKLSSHKDHRIAMSLIVAALGAKKESTIDGVSFIKKSYPNFIKDMQNINAKIKVI